MALTKKQLVKIWKQLDNATEALERLGEDGIETGIDFSAVVSLKNDVEELIDQKTRKTK